MVGWEGKPWRVDSCLRHAAWLVASNLLERRAWRAACLEYSAENLLALDHQKDSELQHWKLRSTQVEVERGLAAALQEYFFAGKSSKYKQLTIILNEVQQNVLHVQVFIVIHWPHAGKT